MYLLTATFGDVVLPDETLKSNLLFPTMHGRLGGGVHSCSNKTSKIIINCLRFAAVLHSAVTLVL